MYFIFIFLLASNLFALENINFEVKEPYPVCIQEAKALEPNLPLSFFDLKKEKPKEQDQSTPCNDYLCNEAKKNNFSGLTNFFQKDFPKVEQELFAQELVKSGNYTERLKALNDTLINCQTRTEELHRIAAEAAGDIYDQSEAVDKIPDGYYLADKKTDFFVFPDSDVKGYVLHPKEPNILHLPPIISFAGTRSLKSAVADLNYGATQVNNVKVKFQQWLNALKLENQKELIITGHSLGGGLAQTLSAMMPEPSDFKTHVVTFNGFGGKDAIKAYNTLYSSIDKNKDYNKFQPTRDAVGYRMEGDVVSLLGERFGETRTIPTKNSSLQIVSNHLMTTIDEQIAASPHALTNAKREDVSTFVRPISFIVQTASYIKAGWDKLTDTADELFTKDCTGFYDPHRKHTNICESSKGDAELCLKEGLELKKDDTKLVSAFEKFKIGCDLCEPGSCHEYAILNKIVGYERKTLMIAKRACDLADVESCIEAGTIIARDLKVNEKSDNQFIILGCENGSAELCKHVNNPEFAQFQRTARANICASTKNIKDCEIRYLSSNQCTLSFEQRKKRIYELLRTSNIELNSQGQTPLSIALESGNSEIAKILMTNGALLSNKERDEAFLLASSNGHIEIVKLMIERGADPTKYNGYVDLPIAEEVREINIKSNDYISSVYFSLVSSGDINSLKERFPTQYPTIKNGSNETLLEVAIKNKDLKMVTFLVEKGAPIPDLDFTIMTTEIKTYLRSQKVSDVTNIKQMKRP